MDETKENWLKIKHHMEAIGKTDNDYYKRACAIASNQPDPWEPPALKSE